MEKDIENMEDMDDELNDDLQMMGSFPVSENSKGTNINIESSSTTFKTKDKSARETKGKELYPQDYAEKVDKLKSSLYKLFSQYERVDVASVTSPTNLPKTNPAPKSNPFARFQHQLIQEKSNESKLNTYLEEDCIVGKREVEVEEIRLSNKDSNVVDLELDE
ncbi:hypothetical protein C2S52_021915 [Perilla frutescens var. hirtella]|nr:hypothetical protein C2S52_021915 [Perilla frutescens var. hirtella]